MLKIYRISLSKKMLKILDMKMMILLKFIIKTQIMRIQVPLMLHSNAVTMENIAALLDQKLGAQSRTLTTDICETNFAYTETCVTKLHENITRQMHGLQVTMHNHLLMSMRGVQPPTPRPLSSVNPLTAADFHRPNLPGQPAMTQEERNLAEARRLSLIEQARVESDRSRFSGDGPTHTSFLSGARNLPPQQTGATVQVSSVGAVPQTA